MGSNGAVQFPMSEQIDGSEPAIEIKIKTLDSQTYTLKVDKQMPVPALKEQIASVTGVLSEQQRLICRGKVLKDDQLLSAYHVEDGHTLHLVVREPIPLPSEGQPNHPGTDPASSTSHGQSSVVFESFSVADGVTPDINQMLSAVFSSIGIGIPNNPSGSEGVDATAHRHFTLGTYGGMFDPSQILSEQAGTRTPSDRSNDPHDNSAAFSFGNMPPPVIPDSLNTLTQYLGHLRRDFDLLIARDGGLSQTASSHTNEESSSFSLGSGTRPEGLLPSPASLAEVMRTARQLLIEQAGESLLQLASQLDQVGVTDSSARMRTQTIALRTGPLFHNLGACLLELGRTMMTLQMGRTPFDAVVNAGPAVFISPTGPNPIMVQPLPFQSGMSLGAIPMGAPGSGFVPRRIEIQIRRGSPTSLNVNREEHGNLQQPSQTNPAPRPRGENSTNQATARVSGSSAFTGDSAVRILPFRTMVPSRLPLDSSASSIGLIYPVLGRSQHVASSNLNGEQGTQASGEQGTQASGDRRPASSGNFGDTARAGSTASIRHPDQSNGRSFSFIVTSGGTQNDQESERQVPSSILNAVRALFPGGEIHVVDGSAQGTTSSSVSDQTRMSSGVTVAPEAEPRVSEEGLFLSNLLHQVMPLISQSETREPGPVHAEVENSSEQRMAQDTSSLGESSNIGSSRRQRDCDNNPPNSKRQKRE